MVICHLSKEAKGSTLLFHTSHFILYAPTFFYLAVENSCLVDGIIAIGVCDVSCHWFMDVAS
jgi:hypothetical protein